MKHMRNAAQVHTGKGVRKGGGQAKRMVKVPYKYVQSMVKVPYLIPAYTVTMELIPAELWKLSQNFKINMEIFPLRPENMEIIPVLFGKF
jgi:hypothetical protein